MTRFDTSNQGALLVQQEGSNGYRHDGTDLSGVFLGGFFFDQAQDRQARGLNITHDTSTITAWAHVAAGFFQGWTQTLTRHFHQAET